MSTQVHAYQDYMHKDVFIVYITLMLLYLSDITIQMKGRIQEELLDFLLLPKAQLQPR